MAGIAEVARLAGVSKSTASRALTGSGYVSDETRVRVQDVAASLGYIPTTSAVSLVTGRTRTIGVVLPALSRWFFARVLEGIQDALLERRYDLALYGAPPDSPTRREMFEHFLSRKRFDGIIAVGIEPRTHELERLVDFGKPVVSVGGYDAGTNAVSIDDTAAGRIARVADINAALGEWVQSRPASVSQDLLQAAGVPAGVVQDGPALMADPQLAARDFWRSFDHQVFGQRPFDRFPALWSGTDLEPYVPSPGYLGEHNFDVFTQLAGMSEEDIAVGMGEGLFG